MPSESSLLLPSLLAQLRSPSTATASLTSSSAADSTSIRSHHSDDDDETSSLEGLARRLNTARNAKRSVHRNRISSSIAAEPVLSSSPPPTTATGPASLRRSDSASSSSAAAAASASASSSSSGTLNRQRHARDDDHRDDDDDDQDGAGKGAVKDEEEEADTEDDDDEGEDDRVQFISRSEGHPDPRDLLRAHLLAANTATTTTATSSPPSSRTRRQGDEILQSNKKAQGQENPNPTRWVSSSSRRVVRDQQRQTRAASPPSSALYEESGRSVSLQPAGSSAASSAAVSVRVGEGDNSTDFDAATASANKLIEMMYLPRRYFILSTAGKLVYTSDSSEEAATGLVGVMQAIVSIFADEGDKIRYIDVGQTKISFLLKAPLYLVVVSSQGEPEAVLRQHLDYLYLQVLSVVTVSQLQNIFAKRSNFDLRQLISGTEPFFDSLVSTLQTSLAVALSSISVYRLPPSLRSDLARALDPGKESIHSLDLLYVLLLAEGRLVTLLRPKKHSIHPTDFHLLLETVYAPRRTSSSSDETESGPPGGDEDDEDEAGQTWGGGENLDQRQQRSKPRPRPRPRPRRRPSPLLEPGAESWFPICLPRFNPRGFLHAYVSFLETSPTSPSSCSLSASSSLRFESRVGGEGGGGGGGEGGAKAEDGIGVVILSSRRDAFVGVQQVAQAIKARLLSSSSSSSSAISTGGGGVSSGSFSSSTPHHPPLPAPPSTSISTSASTAAAAGAADGGLVHSILMSRAHQSYSLGELAIPGLRHFVYKDRERVQVTMPRWEGEYYAAAAAISEEGADDDDDDDAVAASTRARMRLVTLYQRLHAALHPRTSAATVGGREGGGGGASVQYLRTSHEAVLGWMTNDFELYVSTSPLLPPAAMVKCARRVSEWVKRDEARLFLSGKGAGVF